MATRRESIRTTRAQLEQLHGDALRAAAVEIMHHSPDLELVRLAIGKLSTPEDRPELIRKYAWCEAQPLRRDGGGFVRAAIVRALRPIAAPEDSALFLRAMLSYEVDGALEVCGDLRAVGLLAMNELEPELAANFAARFLQDGQVTFSGDPANTAIRLLASHGNLAPIFGLVSWGAARTDVIGEGLRNLTELHADLLPILVEQFLGSEDEQILLGLFDLLLGHPSRDAWAETFERWFRTTTVMDLYGVVAMQVVGSRSDVLIGMLRLLRTEEFDRLRQELLDQALAYA